MDTSNYQIGDVVLFAGTSWISRGIETFTESRYSHAAIYVGDGYIVEATEAGAEKNKLTFSGCSRYCVRRMPNLTDEQRNKLKITAEAFVLARDQYDFAQLLSLGVYFAFRKIGIIWSSLVANMPGRMICSELVGECYVAIQKMLFRIMKLGTPDSLYTSSMLQTVEEVIL